MGFHGNDQFGEGMIGWLDDKGEGGCATVAKGCCCGEKDRWEIKMASCMRVPLQRMSGHCFMTKLGFHLFVVLVRCFLYFFQFIPCLSVCLL